LTTDNVRENHTSQYEGTTIYHCRKCGGGGGEGGGGGGGSGGEGGGGGEGVEEEEEEEGMGIKGASEKYFTNSNVVSTNTYLSPFS
jgi:hypothetical protein